MATAETTGYTDQKTQGSKFDTRFTGKYINRIDAKGRLSIPPALREELQPAKENGFFGIQCMLSLTDEGMIECGGADFIDFLLKLVSNIDEFETARADIEETIYADLVKLSFDKEGRITLPDELRVEAGLEKEVAIVGRGNRFLLMDPARVTRPAARARAFLKDHRDTFRARALPSVSARIEGETS